MGTLVLVRHGQASFGASEYDRLSPLGEEQSRLLGEHLAQRGGAFDAVFAGPRERQRRTAEIARAAVGGAWPEVQTLADLDEMQIQSVIFEALPALAAAEPAIQALTVALMTADDSQARRRAFERLFHAVLTRWVGGEMDAPGIEPWSAFCARVVSVMGVLRAACAGGRRVAAFTSAGPVAVAMATALGVGSAGAVELLTVVRNTGILELLSSGERLSVLSFNGVPHLTHVAPDHLTYR